MSADLVHISRKITEVTGHSPRAWVWPYGAASGTTLRLAKQQGYQMAFTLNQGWPMRQTRTTYPVCLSLVIRRFVSLPTSRAGQRA